MLDTDRITGEFLESRGNLAFNCWKCLLFVFFNIVLIYIFLKFLSELCV